MYADTWKLERETNGRPTVQNIYSVYVYVYVYVYKFATWYVGHPPLRKHEQNRETNYRANVC